MGLYEPKSCCLCFDTKTGSLILALLSLIGAIYSILRVVFNLFNHGVSKASLVYSHVENIRKIHELITVSHEPSLDPHYVSNAANRFVYEVIALQVFMVLLAVCSCLLIHGIRKDRPGLMLPYLVLTRFAIFIKFLLILVVIGLAWYYANPCVLRVEVILILAISIAIYFNIVINAYHKQMKRTLSEDHSILQEEFDIDGNGCKIKV